MAWGAAVIIRYATISFIAVPAATLFLDMVGLFGERQILFREVVRIPSRGGGLSDVGGWFGFVRDLFLMPFDMFMLFVTVVDIWIQMSLMAGPAAPLVAIPGAILVLSMIVLALEIANVVNDLIPFT